MRKRCVLAVLTMLGAASTLDAGSSQTSIDKTVADGGLVCKYPVPKVMADLAKVAHANSSMASDAAKNMGYLVGRYCLHATAEFFDSFKSYKNDDLGLGCFMLTGIYKLEQVYYMDCLGENEGE